MGGHLDPTRLAKLKTLRSGGRPAFPDLARAFLDNSRSVLGGLREASRRGDRRALADLLHKLKGSAAMIGAVDLTDRVTSLEAVVAGASPVPGSGTLEAGLAGLEADIAAVAAELEPCLRAPEA